MPTQHRLLVLVFHMSKKVVDKKVKCLRRIMWGKRKGEITFTFSAKIKSLGYLRIFEDTNHMWKSMAETIREAAKENL